MTYSDCSKSATNKYRSNYEFIQIRVQPGMREIISEHASAHGESINSFVNRVIIEALEKDELPEK